jgi:hypothetical protein
MIRGWWIGLSIVLSAFIWAFLAWAVFAAPGTLVIKNDLGGPVAERVAQIERLRSAGARVEIRGTCTSACTMFLGLPNACVDPSARLGFHGPRTQFYGVPLPPKDFERWSKVMASYYPPQIARWFLRKARYDIIGMITISGSEAIRLGARKC